MLALCACTEQAPESLIASGKAFSDRKDYKAAAIQFKTALQADPRSAEARFLLGKALLDQGDAAGAVSELNKALDDKAPAAQVVPVLSTALVLAGDYKRLVDTYAYLTLDEALAQATLKANVATAWGALGDRPKTEAAIAASLAAVPDFGPAAILKARLLAGKGDFDGAAAVVDGVLAKDAKLHDAWLLRGELLSFARRDTKGAEDAYRRALDVDKTYVPAHSALIYSRVLQRDVAGAKVQADQLRAVAPGHPYTMLVDAHLAYLDRQPARARELTQLLLRSFPDHPGILMLAGSVESELGAVVQAASLFAKVVQLNPSSGLARRSLAEAEIRLGQYTKALETLRPQVSAEPPNAQALSLAGDAELRLGNVDTAERHFIRAAKLEPSNLRLQTAAAMTRLWTGDASVALSELQAVSAKTQDTFADEALFVARLKRSEFDAALEALETLAKKQPGRAAAHQEMRGRVLLARSDLTGAREAFEAALKLDPGLFGAVSSLAFLDVQEGKRDQAVQRLQASASADPKNWVAHMALAEMKGRQGRPTAEVKKHYHDAIAVSGASAEPRLRLIDYTLRTRQFKDALTAAQGALAAHPGDVRVLEVAGQAQMQAGDVEQSVTTFRTLASVLPTSPAPYMKLADVYMATGKRDQAEVAITRALELEPNLAAAQMTYLDLLMRSSRQRSALAHIQRIKSSNPRAALGYSLEAAYHDRLRDVDAAAAALREGLARTDSSELAGKLYSLLWKAGRAAEADRFAATWTRQHPKDAGFDYLLSVTDVSRGNLRAAEERLRRVLAAYPNNAMALNNMAWVTINTGGQGAVSYAQRAVDLLPDQPPLMDTLAMALAADRQTGPALELQKRVVELSPNDNGMRMNLARIALQAGDRGLARQELQRLQQLGAAYPSQAEVNRLLQGL